MGGVGLLGLLRELWGACLLPLGVLLSRQLSACCLLGVEVGGVVKP